MKVVCAWCKKDLGEKEPLEEKTVSHGMCEECYSSITAHMGELADPPA